MTGQQPAVPAEPGIYLDFPEDVYHGDLSALSSTGAKKLVKTVPAQWYYDWMHPTVQEPNETMEFGSAVHSLTLGAGAPVIEIQAGNWRRKAEQEIRKKHRSAGEIPLLTADYKRAVAMADAVRLHPVIGPRLEAAQRELSFWWRDAETGIMRRGRADFAYTSPSGVVLIGDVKTDETADPVEFGRAIVKFGYFQQSPWYRDGLEALGMDATDILFVVVARRPPHLVSLNQVPAPGIARGRELNSRACRTFAGLSATGVWPDYGNDIHVIDQAPWVYRED